MYINTHTNTRPLQNWPLLKQFNTVLFSQANGIQQTVALWAMLLRYLKREFLAGASAGQV